MRRDLHNLDVGDVKEKQRFSIRKLTVGTASVLLGTTFLFGAGQTAYADTTAETSETQAQTTEQRDEAKQNSVGAIDTSNGTNNVEDKTQEQTDLNATTAKQNTGAGTSHPAQESKQQDTIKNEQDKSKDNQVENGANGSDQEQSSATQNAKQRVDNETTTVALPSYSQSISKDTLSESKVVVKQANTANTNESKDAKIDLTFVDDDDNEKIVDYSDYLPSEDGGHHYAYGKVGDKVGTKAYNNGTMSIKRMLDLLDIGYYEPNGTYIAPDTFTSENMTVQIHLKHQTERKVYHTYNLLETFTIVTHRQVMAKRCKMIKEKKFLTIKYSIKLRQRLFSI